MAHHVYKQLELVGSSPNSLEDAIQSAIARSGESVRNLRWFELVQLRGEIEDGKVAYYQATLKLGFKLDD